MENRAVPSESHLPLSGGAQRVFGPFRPVGTAFLARRHAGKGEGAARVLPLRNEAHQLRQHREASEFHEHQVTHHFVRPTHAPARFRPPWLSFSPPLTRSAALRVP